MKKNIPQRNKSATTRLDNTSVDKPHNKIILSSQINADGPNTQNTSSSEDSFQSNLMSSGHKLKIIPSAHEDSNEKQTLTKTEGSKTQDNNTPKPSWDWTDDIVNEGKDTKTDKTATPLTTDNVKEANSQNTSEDSIQSTDQTPEVDQVSDKPKDTSEKKSDIDEIKEEIEEDIISKSYFLPINTISQKRSIKHSLFLTLILFILALILLDLLLDSGLILIVQKIPHTHFFSQS